MKNVFCTCIQSEGKSCQRYKSSMCTAQLCSTASLWPLDRRSPAVGMRKVEKDSSCGLSPSTSASSLSQDPSFVFVVKYYCRLCPKSRAAIVRGYMTIMLPSCTQRCPASRQVIACKPTWGGACEGQDQQKPQGVHRQKHTLPMVCRVAKHSSWTS